MQNGFAISPFCKKHEPRYGHLIFREIFRIFLIKIDTLNLSYFDQREQKSQGSSKKL